MKKLTPTQSLLRFLESYGTVQEDKSTEMFDSIVNFLHQDKITDVIDLVKEKITCKYPDFLDYFDTTENIMALIDLKEEDPEKYYTVIHYANIMLNLLCSLLEMSQTIVLDPEDLRKSYFLVIKLKK
ncbi:MAG: hypothetical protein IJF83_07840 [Methanobrevibacter sp.]|nr:hypothetical protein [Methanobrevibacter sp.]MBR0371657.1 hypothetical protein [Methanobrevibacter sp.]